METLEHSQFLAMITIDDTGTILSASHQVCNVFGYDAEELIGHNISMCMPSPFRELHDQYIRRYMKTGVAHIIGTSRMVEGLHRDGSTFSFRLSISTVDVDGTKLFVGLIEKERESWARVVMEPSGTVVAVNKKFVHMFGYSPDEMIGKDVSKIMPERYAKRHSMFLRNYENTGVKKAIDIVRNLEGQANGGRVFPIVLKVAEQVRGGQKVYVADIQDMETSELIGVITLDATGTIRSSNNAVLEMTGHTAQDLVGLNITAIMPSLTLDTLENRDSQTFGCMHLQIMHKDGSILKASVESTRFTMDNEEVFSLSIRHADQKLKHRFHAHNVAIPLDLDSMGTYVGNYRVGKLIGVGSFAAVFQAVHRITNKQVALKVTENKNNSTVEREIEVLKRISHKNVAALYEVIRTPKLVIMSTEYCSGGDLFEYVAMSRGGGVPEHEARLMFRGIVAGIAHCHANNVLHRDLKLENVLLDGEGTVKIIDFGLSTFLHVAARMNTFCGTPAYASPEVLTGSALLGPESDVWSLGVLLYSLTTAMMPFQTDPALVISGKFLLPSTLSPALANLITSMLQNRTEERITMEGIMKHPWITNEGELPALEPCKPFRGQQLMPVVPEVIELMTGHGFSPDVVIASIRENAFSPITATYKLLLDSHKPVLGTPESPCLDCPPGGGGSGGPTPMSEDHRRASSTRKVGNGSAPTLRKSYRCRKCDHLDSEAMRADSKLLAELQQLQAEVGVLVRAASSLSLRQASLSNMDTSGGNDGSKSADGGSNRTGRTSLEPEPLSLLGLDIASNKGESSGRSSGDSFVTHDLIINTLQSIRQMTASASALTLIDPKTLNLGGGCPVMGSPGGAQGSTGDGPPQEYPSGCAMASMR
eukprot:jgi/Mesvir1/5278/Mv15386-RA.1